MDTSSSITTGNRSFAECQRHSAKAQKHSAKALPSVTLGKEHTANFVSAKTSLPSVKTRALGKHFADGQKTLGEKMYSVKYALTASGLTAGLPSARREALGKHRVFAECHGVGTRQSRL